jgi:hypothetical protein
MCDMGFVMCDMGFVVCDMGSVVCDMGFVVCDMAFGTKNTRPCTSNTLQKGKKEWAYSTSTSRVVPHHSTMLAVRSLTSRFGWDVVHSTSYGRKRK